MLDYIINSNIRLLEEGIHGPLGNLDEQPVYPEEGSVLTEECALLNKRDFISF